MSIYLIKKFTRRLLLRYGSVVLFGCLVGLTLGFWQQNEEGASDLIIYLILICYFVHMFAFVTTIGALMWLIIPEIVHPFFVSRCILVYWTTSFILISVFPVLRNSCANRNCPEVFLVFSVSMIALFIVSIFIVETKDKSEIEIREEFNMKKLPCRKNT